MVIMVVLARMGHVVTPRLSKSVPQASQDADYQRNYKRKISQIAILVANLNLCVNKYFLAVMLLSLKTDS